MKVVEARGLKKRFGDHKVLEDISFDVFEGECFGVLGPPGAGKSTLMKSLYGASILDGGELYINSLNLKENLIHIKAAIGVVESFDSLDYDFTVRQNLELFAYYHGVRKELITQKTELLLKSMGLEPWSDQSIDLLPEGLGRRLALAMALIHGPNLLLLDEPSQGMNLAMRQWLWSYLQGLKAEKKSIWITTHFVEEAQAICDRIAIMDKGKILAIGEPAILIDQLIGHQVVELEVGKAELQYFSTRLNANSYRYQNIGSNIHVHLDKGHSFQEVLNLIPSERVIIRKPNLSDVFLKLSGHTLRESFV
jgi:lipooligosaccharide transport system ATP-binding protein